MSHLLEMQDFHYYYGGIHAVKGIDLYVDKGEIVTIIGANGAGKSTTLNSIAGITNPQGRKGKILFCDHNITGYRGSKVCKSGIMIVIEGRHIFPHLSVYENLLMGAYTRNRKTDLKSELNMVYDLFPRLYERLNQMGGTLSGGEQQMLAIARALLNRPELLLLDEPSLGLAPIVVEEIFEVIKRINKEDGTTILLVEQNSKLALKTANRAYVLQNGEVAMEGKCTDLINDTRVKDAYLGLA